MNKKAIGYVRVSTLEQGESDKFGIDSQKNIITEYALKNGYEIIKWVVDKESGVSDERVGLNSILYSNEIDNPPYEAVIVYKSDRVARDTKLYFYYLYTLEKKNIKLISANEKFDDDDSGFANVYRALILFVAEQERKNINLRTSNGRRVKASKGGYSGGRVPYGYFVHNGKLELEQRECEIVNLIFHLRNQDHTLNYIADFLNRNGYQTRSEGVFYPATIKSILDNEKFYRGYYKYGDSDYVKGQHTPLL